MISRTVREKVVRLGLDLGAFKTERELRVAIRRAEKEKAAGNGPCCKLQEQRSYAFPWCPVHGRRLK